MKMERIATCATALLLLTQQLVYATTRYVAPGGSHTSPFTSWATAANDIQSAVNVAANGNTVMVSNGTYSVGATIVVNKPITLKSVNGSAVTIIDGGNARRCLELSHGAIIDGFTISNGWAPGGAGLTAEGASVLNCVIRDNVAYSPEGARAGFGGGAQLTYTTIYNCIVENNHADTMAGGIDVYLGGVRIENTIIRNNSAGSMAGGVALEAAYSATSNVMVNCLVTGNHAGSLAGGVYALGGDGENTLVHVTVVGNSAGDTGGGVVEHSLLNISNSIIYGNDANSFSNFAYYSYSDKVSYSCIAPLVPGTMNTDANPMFINPSLGDYRLSAASPCIDAGVNVPGIHIDLDGLPRVLDGNGDGIATADMGCYEFWRMEIEPDVAGMNLKWAGSPDRTYVVYATSDLRIPFMPIATGIVGRTPFNIFTNDNPAVSMFYAVGIE